MSSKDNQEKRRRSGRPLKILPILLFGLLGVVFYWGLWNNDDRLPSTLIGRPIPEFALPPIEGRQDGLGSANLQDQVSLVNVWASWCVPCRTENPLLVDLAEAGTVPIYGINYKDEDEAARRWLRELGDPYRANIVDREGTLGVDLGVYGAPETYLVDAAGVIRYRHVGVVDDRVWRDTLEPIWREVQAMGEQP